MISMKPWKLLRTTYIAGFLFSFHTALTIYINSSFLVTKIPESLIGELYAAAAIVSIIGLFVIPRLIARYGTRITLGVLLVLNCVNVLGLILSSSAPLVMLCFVLFFGFNTVLYLGFDILIERFSNPEHQGTVRGAYLTALNIGFMLAPLIAGYIADRLGFRTLYSIALVILIPIIGILVTQLPTVKNPHVSKLRFFTLVRQFLKNKNLRFVFMVNGTLQFFYVWMTIYAPLYLHEHIHISWDRIGLMFTIMLSAFVIFQYLTGKLADRFHCERPMMVTGLLIMGIASMMVARAPLMSFWAITAIFFITRVGASIVEVMTESYFFKHVPSDDVGTIGFFRNTYPIASILAATTGAVLLQWIPLWNLFIILGVICLVSVFLVFGIAKKNP